MKLDVGKLDRIASLVVTLGLVPLVLRVLWSADHVVPPAWPVALLGAFAAVKAVVAVLGARARWKPWPALVLEIAALVIVVVVVWWGLRTPALVVVAGALLVGAYLVRRRAAVAAADEDGYGSPAGEAPRAGGERDRSSDGGPAGGSAA